jgi:hypothetical protein
MDRPVVASRVKNLYPDPRPAPAPEQGKVAALPPAPATSIAPPEAVTGLSPPRTDALGAAAPERDKVPPLPPTPIAPAEDVPALITPGDTGPKTEHPARQPDPVRKRRASAVKGAIIVSQDGYSVYYRKKCTECGYEDGCRSCMPIGNGIVRSYFFCTKCRKNREVILQCLMQ